MGETGRVGSSLNRPTLGNNDSGWWHRRFCSKTEQTQNLQNFRSGVEYLSNKYGNEIPKLSSRLASKLDHYQSNGRGEDGKEGRLRSFTDKDLRKLESKAEREILGTLCKDIGINLSKVGQPGYLTKSQVERTVQDYQRRIEHGTCKEHALRIAKSRVALHLSKIEEKLPTSFDIDYTLLSDIEMRAKLTNHLSGVMSEKGVITPL